MSTPALEHQDPPSRKAAVVLGMHRSGTSALAGLFSNLGFTPPCNQIRPNSENPKGFFEATPIARFNDRLLAKLNSRWDDWSFLDIASIPPGETETLIEEARSLLRTEFGDAERLVLKDPRICRLVPFWHQVLEAEGITPFYVHTHRNPGEVAGSLQKRNGFSLAYGLIIWMGHVLQAEQATRGRLRAFTCYDGLLRDWNHEVIRLVSILKQPLLEAVPGELSDVSSFLAPELRHFRNAGDGIQIGVPVPISYQTCLEIMNRWSSRGEDPEDFQTLNGLGEDFRRYGALMAELLAYGIQLGQQKAAG